MSDVGPWRYFDGSVYQEFKVGHFVLGPRVYELKFPAGQGWALAFGSGTYEDGAITLTSSLRLDPKYGTVIGALISFSEDTAIKIVGPGDIIVFGPAHGKEELEDMLSRVIVGLLNGETNLGPYYVFNTFCEDYICSRVLKCVLFSYSDYRCLGVSYVLPP